MPTYYYIYIYIYINIILIRWEFSRILHFCGKESLSIVVHNITVHKIIILAVKLVKVLQLWHYYFIRLPSTRFIDQDDCCQHSWQLVALIKKPCNHAASPDSPIISYNDKKVNSYNYKVIFLGPCNLRMMTVKKLLILRRQYHNWHKTEAEKLSLRKRKNYADLPYLLS